MSGLTGRTAASNLDGQGQLWAVLEDRDLEAWVLTRLQCDVSC